MKNQRKATDIRYTKVLPKLKIARSWEINGEELKSNRREYFNPSRPDPGWEGKINLNFYFPTSL